jgi:sugar O-acyltransferase (sialic acid O-acetyltransferase NeuD family)
MATIEATAQGTHPGRAVTARGLAILGGGEHARVVIDAVDSTPGEWVVIGYIAPTPDSDAPGGRTGQPPYLGDDQSAALWMADRAGPERPWLVLGVGLGVELAAREAIVERHRDWDQWAAITHARASVSPTASLSPGAVVLAGAVVGPGAAIGEHAVVNSAAVIEHDVSVEPFAMVGPGAVVGGGVRIGRGALIGLGARIRDHVSIGPGAVVGMGAVVVDDVAADSRVVGIPARPMGTGR